MRRISPISEAVSKFPGDTKFRWMLAWGMGIAAIAVIQVAVATVIALRLDPKFLYACLLLPLYPLAVLDH